MRWPDLLPQPGRAGDSVHKKARVSPGLRSSPVLSGFPPILCTDPMVFSRVAFDRDIGTVSDRDFRRASDTATNTNTEMSTVTDRGMSRIELP